MGNWVSHTAVTTLTEADNITHRAQHFSHSQSIIHNTVRAEIFAVVLFSRISRVKPSRKFPLQFMSIYSNDNISKIAKLTTRELPHLAKTAKITVRENNGVYSITQPVDLHVNIKPHMHTICTMQSNVILLQKVRKVQYYTLVGHNAYTRYTNRILVALRLVMCL